MRLRIFALLFVLSLMGCKFSIKDPADFAKFALPMNVAVAWFGNVAIHEGGHSIAAYGLGADRIHVSVLPEMDSDGDYHFGLTTARFPNGLSNSGASLFHASGPASTFLSHVTFGEINRSGRVSKYLQPTLGWLDFGGMVSTYAHSIFGLSRMKHTDLGKEDVWIATSFLVGQLIYDIVRIGLSDGGFEKYFKVLFGESFYEIRKRQ